MNNSVFYSELTPSALKERIEKCPVGYLPLGTLEWHSWHLPIGTDAIEGHELLKMLAQRVGGVVFPPLFLGPDISRDIDGDKYIGMEIYGEIGTTVPYPAQHLQGSCYWVPDEIFKGMIDAIAFNAKRNGIKVLMGTGHCPSYDMFGKMAEEIKKKYDITILTSDMGDPETFFIPDHAAKYETSNMMYFRPELVHMENLSKDPKEYPLAISGEDPRGTASAEFAKQNIERVLNHMEKLVRDALSVL